METTVLYLLCFIVIMTLIFWMMNNQKIKTITASFVAVLSVLPLVGIVKAICSLKRSRNKK
jgi:membrane protein YdbS with pleckstrin-like domain